MGVSLSLAATLLLAASSVTGAQKRCVKGIPCGGTCISASKTCHVGSGTATRAPEPERSPASQADATPTTSGDIDLSSTAQPQPLAADTTHWVALPGGTVYYRANCEAAREFPADLLVTYPREPIARRAGLRRSKVAGC